MTTKPVILFDGICNLCNWSVQYVIRHDPGSKFQFATFQGKTGSELAAAHSLPAVEPNSFVLIQEGRVYNRSTAALKVVKQLKGPVKLLYGFIIVPKFIRDAVYRLFARNRYKWFGKKDSCMVPGISIANRFLN